MSLMSTVVSIVASALMYWITPFLIRKNRLRGMAIFLIVLYTNVWCYTEIMIIRNWKVYDYLIAAMGDVVMVIIVSLTCYGNFFKNVIVFYAGCYIQQIIFLILISVAGMDQRMNDYFNGREVRLTSAVILFIGSVVATLITIAVFRRILLRWTDERSSAYRIIAAILMAFSFIAGLMKQKAAISHKGAIAVIVITGVALSLMAVFLFYFYDKLQVRWIRKQHDTIKKLLETDELVDGYTKQFADKGVKLFMNELSIKTEKYMSVAVVLLDEMLKYSLTTLGKDAIGGYESGHNAQGESIVDVHVREHNGSLIWSVEMISEKNPVNAGIVSEAGQDDRKGKMSKDSITGRRAYLELKYMVENQGGILINEAFQGGSRMLATVPMK